MRIEPIGRFVCRQTRKYESPRQPGYDSNEGVVELTAGKNFEQALIGLEGFRKIWLIFGFHENSRWKSMVRPQNSERKVGVFATRAPYRPNQLGMSCVTLEEVSGRQLFVSGHDLLDGTPIYDIKPYHPQADAFSKEEALRDDCWFHSADAFTVVWSENALQQVAWLEERELPALKNFVHTQLGTQPFDSSRKRVRRLPSGKWCLAYRTWRIEFADLEEKRLQVEEIRSGYSAEEMAHPGEDRYLDKKIHSEYIHFFGSSLKGSQNEAVF